MVRGALLCVLAVACGRIGFDALPGTSDGRTSDGRTSDGGLPGDSGGAAAIAWVQSFAQRLAINASSDTFTAQAEHVGDALVLHVSCNSSLTGSSSVEVAATPTWSATMLGAVADGQGGFAASFGAIATDTMSRQFTVAWSPACNPGDMVELGDEFANTDASGGVATFDAHNEAFGVGNCTTTLVTGHANDAVWAACTSAGVLTAPGSGYTKAADDISGDWSEYRITNDQANTSETPTFGNSQVGFLFTAVTISPR